MRIILSMLVLLLFGLPMAAPLLALAQDAPAAAGLHACCRRGGAHHCASPSDDTGATSIGAPALACPYMPGSVVATDLHLLGPGASAAAYAGLVSHPAVHAQTDARRRIALDPARQKRGPPASLSL